MTSTYKEVIFISKEYKNTFSEYGKKVKIRLTELDKPQSWLIEEVRKKTNMFVDNSVLNKLLTGRLNSERIVSAINEILCM